MTLLFFICVGLFLFKFLCLFLRGDNTASKNLFRVVRATLPPEVRRAYIIRDSCQCILLPMNHPLRISQQVANFGTHGHPYTRGFPRLNGQPTLTVPRRHKVDVSDA